MSRPRIVIQCSTPQDAWRHRWRWRDTHYRMPDGAAVRDRWCVRCGSWYLDVIEPQP